MRQSDAERSANEGDGMMAQGGWKRQWIYWGLVELGPPDLLQSASCNSALRRCFTGGLVELGPPEVLHIVGLV